MKKTTKQVTSFYFSITKVEDVITSNNAVAMTKYYILDKNGNHAKCETYTEAEIIIRSLIPGKYQIEKIYLNQNIEENEQSRSVAKG